MTFTDEDVKKSKAFLEYTGGDYYLQGCSVAALIARLEAGERRAAHAWRVIEFHSLPKPTGLLDADVIWRKAAGKS